MFELHGVGDVLFAEPIYFRNDNAGVENFVDTTHEEAGRTIRLFAPRLKNALRSFAQMWFRNLRAQGFLDRDPAREVLSRGRKPSSTT